MDVKDFFPYQFLDPPEKLKYDRLPVHEIFYSCLKNANISDEYAFCQKVGHVHKMTTFPDFLVWYNNLDVEPLAFFQAVTNLQKYYFDRNLDIFKCRISGLARQMLLESARKEGAAFSLLDTSTEDLYDAVKQNTVPKGANRVYHYEPRKFSAYIRGEGKAMIEMNEPQLKKITTHLENEELNGKL